MRTQEPLHMQGTNEMWKWIHRKNQFDKVEIIQEMRTDAAPPEDEEKESESKH